METIGSLSQSIKVLPDLNNKSCKDLGNEHIFFNVHKIYVALASFTFESTLLITCGNVLKLKIVQTLQAEYNFENKALVPEHFKEIVEKLFSDSINYLQEHIENTRMREKKGMPDITVSLNVLTAYLSSMNYKDLYKSCFSE